MQYLLYIAGKTVLGREREKCQESDFAFPVVNVAQESQAGTVRSPFPAGQPALGVLHQASVVRHHFVLRKVESKLQGHQHWELKGNQLSPVQPELLFQFLQGWPRKQNKIFVSM